ncbi:hypothetical protein L195_g044586, partial [Trifolium pratense]
MPPKNDTYDEANFSFRDEYVSRNHTTYGLPQTEPPNCVTNMFANYLAKVLRYSGKGCSLKSVTVTTQDECVYLEDASVVIAWLVSMHDA